MRKGPTFTIDVIIEPDGDEFHAYCPGLKGLHTCGSTEEEALQNAKDAAVAYLVSLMKHGDPIPIGITSATSTRKRNSSQSRVSHRVVLATPASAS